MLASQGGRVVRRLPACIVLVVSLVACTSSVTQSTSASSRSPRRSTDAAHPSPECDGHFSLAADIDGDGRTDLVYHDFVRGNAELGVCTAAGSRLNSPGIGQSELLEVIALPTDGRHVILFGTTSVSAQFYDVAAIIRDRLTKVRLPGGGPADVERRARTRRVERSGCGGVRLQGERF
jgi:hypothetical protein